MSILSDLIHSITGNEESEKVTERPCSNCPSSCAIAGDACAVCEPYKKRLIDQVYLIDHLEEYYARYEVTGTAGETVVTCPYCGATSRDPFTCEYCGSVLSSSSGKIRVEKASDIPNPITAAQDIIFERADAVMEYASGQSSSSEDSILGSLFSFLKGSGDTEADNPLGAKMSEAEIKEAASLYGVSVSAYLTGLDNGDYLTLAGKKAEDTASEEEAADAEYTVIPGVAGVGTLAGALHGSHGMGYRPRPADHREDMRPSGYGNPPFGQAPPNMRPNARPQGPGPQRPGSMQGLGSMQRPGGQQGPGSPQRPGGGRDRGRGDSMGRPGGRR